jgi:mRNA-degrading endonuclease RelE of RelBE toxin-antitoxin system
VKRSIRTNCDHASFRRDFAKLPRNIQERARAAYRRFQADPSHPGLQFKQLHSSSQLWSVRVTESYRAVGVRDGDKIIWFFIGTPAEYDRLLANL